MLSKFRQESSDSDEDQMRSKFNERDTSSDYDRWLLNFIISLSNSVVI